LDLKDLKVDKARKDLQELARQVLKDHRALRVLKARRVLKDFKAVKVPEVFKDRKASKELEVL
jgi:Holliday junction resolvasome RuvABC ATP-dependent DNA helicase subunit